MIQDEKRRLKEKGRKIHAKSMNEGQRSKADFRHSKEMKCLQRNWRKVRKEGEPGRKNRTNGIFEMERQKKNSGRKKWKEMMQEKHRKEIA